MRGYLEATVHQIGIGIGNEGRERSSAEEEKSEEHGEPPRGGGAVVVQICWIRSCSLPFFRQPRTQRQRRSDVTTTFPDFLVQAQAPFQAGK